MSVANASPPPAYWKILSDFLPVSMNGLLLSLYSPHMDVNGIPQLDDAPASAMAVSISPSSTICFSCASDRHSAAFIHCAFGFSARQVGGIGRAVSITVSAGASKLEYGGAVGEVRRPEADRALSILSNLEIQYCMLLLAVAASALFFSIFMAILLALLRSRLRSGSYFAANFFQRGRVGGLGGGSVVTFSRSSAWRGGGAMGDRW